MNYKNIAGHGRGGDTELRKVDGKLSHVSIYEAEAIDMYGKLGEALVKEVGSGTTNPVTGLPEYEHIFGISHGGWDKNIKPIGNMSLPDAVVNIASLGAIDTSNEEKGWLFNYKDMESGISEGQLFGHETRWERDRREQREQQEMYSRMGYDKSGFTHTDGEFDPTSGEFRESVEQYGNFGELLYGYGMDPDDKKFFDKPNFEKLDQMSDRYDLDVETMSTATGTGISNIKGQGDVQRSKANMAFSGSVGTMEKKATTSIWNDYNNQKESLQMDLAEGESKFWEDVETRYYDTMLQLETNS